VKKKFIIGLLLVVVIAGGVTTRQFLSRETPLSVTVEAIRSRDLEAIVAASGTIQPQRQVDISANTMGRVTRLGVVEGQRVEAGQFLLELDPRSLEGQLQQGEARVAVARSTLAQARTGVEQAEANVASARQAFDRQQQLWDEGLTTRETLERAETELAVRETDLRSREQDIETREQQILQEQANFATTQYNLSQIVIDAPMSGIVTRRNIEEGENVVVGTMNNAGTVLLTIADMSIIQAEVEIDETEVPSVKLGQPARVTIDAFPDEVFSGRVTEIGNSPVQAASQANAQTQATSFQVIVTIDDEIPNIRPGFTATAEITTAIREAVVAVPIQSLTVRELLFDEEGEVLREPPPERPRALFGRGGEPATRVPPEPGPGQQRKDTQGVFLMREDRAVFTPVEIGIAGEQYFEVLSGVTTDDRVIIGPFAEVRRMADGEAVEVEGADEQVDGGGPGIRLRFGS
jgi:HlyD family secretion protein